MLDVNFSSGREGRGPVNRGRIASEAAAPSNLQSGSRPVVRSSSAHSICQLAVSLCLSFEVIWLVVDIVN